MTVSGQRGIFPAENVAASEPAGGPEQSTVSGNEWAHCVFCGLITSEPVFVGSSEQNSGPGIAHYADPGCARAYANTSEAPEWLREQYRQAAEQDDTMEAYAAYVHHVTPPTETGKPPCPKCSAADSPNTGCEEGIELWGAYRLVRIKKRAK